MDKEKELKKDDVKFLTSFTMAVSGLDDEIKHLQFVVVQVLETREIRCFMDVVDPSKIKLAEND